MSFGKASVRSVQFSTNVNLTALAASSVGTSGIVRLTNGEASLDTHQYIISNQTITVSGDASGSGTTSLVLTLANSGVTAGTYTSVTVNEKGLVIGGTNPTGADAPTINVIGDVYGSGTTSLTLNLYNSGVTAGTYTSVAVNAKGIVTNGYNPSTLSAYGITDGASLSTNTFTGVQTFVGVKETKITVAASAIDVSLGTLFTKTITGATTFTISNTAASGLANSFILELTNGGSAAVTWWSGVKWTGGTAPTLTTSGVDILGFYTYDGGTTWRGLVLSKDSK